MSASGVLPDRTAPAGLAAPTVRAGVHLYKRRTLTYVVPSVLGTVLPFVSRSPGGPALDALVAYAAPAVSTPRHGWDAALFWNEVLLEAMRVDSREAPAAQAQGGPTRASRAAAIVHIAIHNAVNAVQRLNTLYQDPKTGRPAPPEPAPTGARLEAAGAGAGHASLSALYPRQKALFDQKLAEFRALPVAGAGHQPSIEFGARVAAGVLASRADDGANAAESYTPPKAGPGVWEPDPILAPPGIPLSPHWGRVRPFLLASGAQLRPPPPPAVTTGDYSFGLTRVYVKGSFISPPPAPPPLPPNAPPGRTEDETIIAKFWSYDDARGTPIRLYNQHARQILDQEPFPPAGVSPVHRHARFLALVNIAMADAGIACWESKYLYNYWRPYQGIRRAAADDNPYTAPNPDWIPLGRPLVPRTTPSFPAYVSGHSAFGSAAFAVAGKYFERRFDFALTSEECPGVSRHYRNTAATTALQQAVAENSESRIFLGVHFWRDHTAGRPLGQQVADFIWPTFMRPTT